MGLPPHAPLLGELRRCGYKWSGGAVVVVSPSARLSDTKAYAEKFDLSHLGEHIHRIEKSVNKRRTGALRGFWCS